MLISIVHETYVARREKTNVLHMRKQTQIRRRGNRESDQRLCFRYLDRTIPIFPKSKISSL